MLTSQQEVFPDGNHSGNAEQAEAWVQANVFNRMDAETTETQSALDAEEVDGRLTPPAAPVAIPGSWDEMEAGPSSPVKGRNGHLSSLADDDSWQRFDVLETAPADHHYYQKKIAAPGRAYLSRIAKEHRALRTSLPGESGS